MGSFDFFARPVRLVDSHTEGEPTRVLLAEDWPFDAHSVAELQFWLAQHFDEGWRSVCNEPRGFPAMVGAILRRPNDPRHTAAVVFFNNAGVLNMCGHGTIGLVRTLEWLGRLSPGPWSVETPVGVVRGTLHPDGAVTFTNVPSHRAERDVRLTVEDRAHRGETAWGGNWFYICDDHGLDLEPGNIPALTRRAAALRGALMEADVRGDDGGEIDHIELTRPLADAKGARAFVLCPGGEYDRSPCGTGTSAKVACLAADGLLAPGEVWRQESVTGGVFTATYQRVGGRVVPEITGRAFVTGETTLVYQPGDPLRLGTGA